MRTASSPPDPSVTHRAIALVTGLFFLWGVANNLNDVLIAHFRRIFTLTDFQSGLVQSAFYLGYFCFAVPASMVMTRFGYKRAVIVGLALFAAGALLFWPAALGESYPAFLFALYVIASGLAFLETAANPMVASLGPAASAERRLNFAQAFNPLGSISGVALGAWLILPAEHATAVPGATSVLLPYTLIAAVVLGWGLLLARTRFPVLTTTEVDERHERVRLSDYRALLRRPRYVAGVAAQFCYVGAQVGVWSYLIRYVDAALPRFGQRDAAWLLTGSLALFMLGRFIGTALLGRVSGASLMLVFAGIDALLCFAGAIDGRAPGVAAMVATSFFMSIMYPTIFVLTLRDLGRLTKPGAAMIVMAIVAAGIIPPLMGLLSDQVGSIAPAMLIPGGCFVAVAAFALSHRRDGATA